MLEKTNFVKLYKIMRKLTAMNNRKTLSKMIKNIKAYNDNQVFELMHAVNTGVDITKLTNPNLSSAQMRQIRLDQEFGKTLTNVKNNHMENINGEEVIVRRI